MENILIAEVKIPLGNPASYTINLINIETAILCLDIGYCLYNLQHTMFLSALETVSMTTKQLLSENWKLFTLQQEEGQAARRGKVTFTVYRSKNL